MSASQEPRIGPDGRPHVSLSAKSLGLVSAWCGENPNEKLAKAYMQAAMAFGEARECASKCLGQETGVMFPYLWEIIDRTGIMRDHIGRRILKRIKSEKAKRGNQ